METIEIDCTDMMGFQLGKRKLRVHEPTECRGPFCCIHSPSDHHMRNWPLNWRSDSSMMERLCRHGVGHPDPDDLEFRRWNWPKEMFDGGIHGCDGCCVKPT